jgi:hypothetical protein
MAASGQFNLIKQWCEISIDPNVKRIVQQPKISNRRKMEPNSGFAKPEIIPRRQYI